MNKLPTKGQIVKTKSGDKTWRVLRIVDGTILLEGVTNLKFKRLAVEQFAKTWKVVPAATYACSIWKAAGDGRSRKNCYTVFSWLRNRRDRNKKKG